MNQSFFIGAVGASQQMKQMNVQGNNIANLNTYGFKAEKGRFTSLMYTNIRGIEDDELPSGVGARQIMTSTDFSNGAPLETGRSQDYYIEGDGFFALADLRTGEITFTRNGAFAITEYDRQSVLPDEEGNPVYQTVLALTDNDGRFVLGEDGDIIVVAPEDIHKKLPVGVFDYINYDGMTHLSDTRFMPVDKNGGLMVADDVRLHQGFLEQSNADLAEEMTKVIEAQRAYTMALRMVQTSDEIETVINNLRS